MFAIKLIEKTLDLCNTKGHYQSFLRKETQNSHKFFKTENISQVGSNSSLYINAKKVKMFWTKKNVKITKQAHAF